jgi:translation initiation factor 2 alpha subunit (eIF-2alpha)
MIKEDDIVMCTVKRIEGASVFLEIEGNGEGSMTMSEVAAGRIRNLRDYVVVNKKIVCKVLKIINGHPQLSLRRVTGKEREELQERYKKEKSLTVLLKNIVKEYDSVIAKIKESHELWKFYDEIKENPELLSKFVKKPESETIIKLILEKKEKEKISKKEFILKSSSSNGLEDIKNVLDVPGVDIRYLGSSNFSISVIAKDFKEANQRVIESIEKIEKMAKERKMFFEFKEK